MVYTVSSSLKRQVQQYVFLENLESATGYLVLLLLSCELGSFGDYMTAKILWTSVALVVSVGLSMTGKYVTRRTYFHGIACSGISKSQGIDYRLPLGKIFLLEGNVVSTVGFVAAIAIIRFWSVVGVLLLAWLQYRDIPSVTKDPDYHLDRGRQRLHEFQLVSLFCVVLYCVLNTTLMFFSLGYSSLTRLLHDTLAPAWYAVRTLKRLRQTDASEFMERLERVQKETELGITWYVHLNRHAYLTAKEAQAEEQTCGLPAYWFFSVRQLMEIVRMHLVDLVDDSPYHHSTSMDIFLALEALKVLSRQRSPCSCDLFGESGRIGNFLQDLPQARRCAHDVDASRDFVQANGYVAMLQVLECCRLDSHAAQLAASIVAGLTWSLSVLLWQPAGGKDQKNRILRILGDDDFRYCTNELVHRLVWLVQMNMKKKPDRDPSHLAVLEAAMFGVSSFAEVASDIHAHSCDPGLLADMAEDSTTTSWVQAPPPTQQGLQASTAITPPCDWSQKINDQGLGSGNAIRFSNAFTTLCPAGWLLGTGIPDFRLAQPWVDAVKSVLSDQTTLDSLLLAALSDKVAHTVKADSIRALSALWSCRMIYWHRFDKRMPRDFPAPLVRIDHLLNPEEVKQRLRLLVHQCLDSASLSPFSKLHTARIVLSQGIRDMDQEVTTILLQCLCYWRRALGPQELDWFACEVIETLNDLLTTSSDSSEIKTIIKCSPGGLQCVTLMLSGHVSRLHAVRFGSADWVEDFVSNQAGKRWAERDMVHNSRCFAAASSLLLRLLLPMDPLPIIIPSPEDSPEFFDGVLRSLNWIVLSQMAQYLDEEKEGSRGRRDGGGGSSSSLPSNCMTFLLRVGRGTLSLWKLCRPKLSQWTSKTVLRFVLCLESLGNPAWRPSSLTSLQDVNPVICGHDRLEHLERCVTFLIGAREAIHLIDILVQTYPRLRDDRYLPLYFPSLVSFLTVRFSKLPERLGVQKWEAECEHDMKNRAAKILACTVQRARQLVKDNSLPLTEQSLMLQALTILQNWAKAMGIHKHTRLDTLDLENNAGWGSDGVLSGEASCLLMEVAGVS